MVAGNIPQSKNEECLSCQEEISKLAPVFKNCFNSIPGSTWQEKLDYVNQCNCCERHQIDKPKIYSPWKDTVFKGTNHIGRCACDCRHKARFICRQHKGNISLISVNGDKRQKLQ